MSDYRYEGFGVRLTRLTAEMQARLRAALPGFEIESRDPEIAAIAIDLDQDLQPLCSFLERDYLHPSACSVWISLTTTKEIDHFVLPRKIVDLIRMTKCGVEFSLIALSPEEDAVPNDAADTGSGH